MYAEDHKINHNRHDIFASARYKSLTKAISNARSRVCQLLWIYSYGMFPYEPSDDNVPSNTHGKH